MDMLKNVTQNGGINKCYKKFTCKF